MDSRAKTLLLILLFTQSTRTARADDSIPPLSGLCEASAVHALPCAGGKGSCVVVGDNEDDTALFEYRLGADGMLKMSDHWWQAFDGAVEIGDIESVTTLDGDVVAVGSHSRKKACDRKDKRLRLAHLRRSDTGVNAPTFSAHGAVVADEEADWVDKLQHCATKLIVLPADATAESRGLRDEVCRAIVDTEGAAGEGKQTAPAAQSLCQQTFNIEGAVGLPDGEGKPERLWLGLRAPLVDGKAIVLRVAENTASRLTFDGVATLDLGGLGVREFALSRDTLYGLAGPVPDGGRGMLWRIPAKELHTGARIGQVTRVLPDLDGRAEGLVIAAGPTTRAVIVFDGDQGDQKNKAGAPKSCSTPAGHRAVALP